jgi:hypothetical protein
MNRLGLVWFLFGITLTCVASAKTTASSNDDQAIVFAAQAMTAMTGGASISDATLTGTVTWTAGDSQAGTVTLSAKGLNESRVDLNLGNGTRSDVRNSSTGAPQGAWVASGGTVTAYVQHNCWTDASWFFPILSSLSQTTNPSFIFSYIGAEQRNGVSVQHIQIYQLAAAGLINSPVPTLSLLDFYLDATSFLPVAVSFTVHTDLDMNVNILTEIDFSNYQSVNGIQVPFSVQRSLNGSVLIDVTVTDAVFNSGLPDSLFSLQETNEKRRIQ